VVSIVFCFNPTLGIRDRKVAIPLLPEIDTYLEVLVAGLLVLLSHGGRLAAGEEASETEEHTGCTDTQHDVHEDLGALTRRSLSAGTVRAKCDPVSCVSGLALKFVCYFVPYRIWDHVACIAKKLFKLWCAGIDPADHSIHIAIFPPSSNGQDSRRTSLLLLQSELVPVGAHAIPQGHPQLGLLLGRHGLPSLLNVCKGRVGDSVCLARLLESRGSGGRRTGRDPGGGRERGAKEGGCAEHYGGRRSPMAILWSL